MSINGHLLLALPAAKLHAISIIPRLNYFTHFFNLQERRGEERRGEEREYLPSHARSISL
jgi:hypothetical protein